MLTVRLVGGLGNQMFQYASALALAKKLGTDLLLDASEFQTYKLHAFGLSHFKISAPVRLTTPMGRKIEMKLKRFGPVARLFSAQSRTYQEPHFHFDPSFFRVKDGSILDGYWQSPKYFESIRSVLLSEFTLKEPLSPYSREISELIRSSDSISLHVRRGDYVSNPQALKFHGIVPVDHYRAALEKAGLTAKSKVFVFSDDKKWVQENLDLGVNPVFVQNGKDKGQEDLALMALCRTNITANSTFSWWGAWLNQNADKRVIAPRKWFAEPSMNSSDLLPQEWVLL
jgi:hypothetical protein